MSRLFESEARAVLLLAAAVVLVFILLLNWVFQPTMDGIEWREETYIVQRGETLWTIAGDYCPKGVDRREWIDEIQALNHLQGSTIYTGQRLTVLAPTKEAK